ncbi:MAG: aminomethyl-transferring glycine dehydrogenase subunit GcvPA, partial [Steroidobacteraceae bacterium]|nr:aminomethyl-transferring glycine dehydrogenase subunit GcvPA [Steroidobacteraceae bacterium]
DGGSALAEAALMAVRAHRRSKSSRILVPRTVHPLYRKVAIATASHQGLRFEELPYARAAGITDAAALTRFESEDCTALVIQQPNFFGNLEEVDRLTDWAHAHGMLVIAVVNPTALALLKPPGRWGQKGADIVVGDGQPLGVPLSSGGPYFGFMTTRLEYVRQMPGRIVGRTVDLNGKSGFTLTLQAREQHIRRAKATSNICTNQGLLVTAATIYLALLGPDGLARVAAASHARTNELVAALTRLRGVRLAFDRPRFHEAVLQLDRPAARVLADLQQEGILGGFDLAADYPELGSALLVCATETKTAEDIERYAAALERSLRAAAA